MNRSRNFEDGNSRGTNFEGDAITHNPETWCQMTPYHSVSYNYFLPFILKIARFQLKKGRLHFRPNHISRFIKDTGSPKIMDSCPCRIVSGMG
jgi:hypothetical protein